MTGKRAKVGRNEPCTYGSGKKYKQCCHSKAFQFKKDANGNIVKQIPLNQEMRDIFKESRQHFIDKHGREPGPNDKLFDFEPEHLEHETVQALKRAGIRPAIVHAYIKTGRLVSEQNQHLLSDRDLAEWNAAVNEYEDGFVDDL